MSSTMRLILLVLLGIIVLTGLAFVAPLPIRFRMDFQVLWHANLGILNGVALYDRAGQAAMLARLNGGTPEQQFVLPFPYPPWFATLTLPIAALPVQAAARLWFLLDLAMLAGSVWLLSDGRAAGPRLALMLGSALFPPAAGALFVGQFVFPTLLGIAMLVHALRGQRPLEFACAAALITFKPHVGVFVLAAALFLLLKRSDGFTRQSVRYTLGAAAVLIGLGFVADPAWPRTYLASLSGFSEVSRCQLCVSLPMMLATLLGGGLSHAFLIALASLVLLLVTLIWRGLPNPGGEAGPFIGLSVCAGLLINPYLQNYDFTFLLIPFLVLAGRAASPASWTTLLAAYALPWLGLGVLGRLGGATLLVSTAILAVTFIRLTRVVPARTIHATE